MELQVPGEKLKKIRSEHGLCSSRHRHQPTDLLHSEQDECSDPGQKLQADALSTFKTAVKYNISLEPEWIPRENEVTDYISRIITEAESAILVSQVQFPFLFINGGRCIRSKWFGYRDCQTWVPGLGKNVYTRGVYSGRLSLLVSPSDWWLAVGCW